MKELLLAIRREFLTALHDPRRLVFLFGAAVAYLIVFGLLYVPNIVKDVPCVVYDAENSHFSRELVRDIESSDSMRAVLFVDSEEDMREALRQKQAYAAIEIPADFSRKVKTGQSAEVLYMANGANIILTNITSSAMQDILANFSDRFAAERTALRTGGDEELLQHMISPVHAHLRVLYNTTQGYMFFFLLGLAMVAFQQGILFAVGAAICGEYEQLRAGEGDWQGAFLAAARRQARALLRARHALVPARRRARAVRLRDTTEGAPGHTARFGSRLYRRGDELWRLRLGHLPARDGVRAGHHHVPGPGLYPVGLHLAAGVDARLAADGRRGVPALVVLEHRARALPRGPFAAPHR